MPIFIYSESNKQSKQQQEQAVPLIWHAALTQQLNQYESRSQEPIKHVATVMWNTRTEPAVKWMAYKQQIITLSNQTHALSQRPFPFSPCPPPFLSVCARLCFFSFFFRQRLYNLLLCVIYMTSLYGNKLVFFLEWPQNSFDFVEMPIYHLSEVSQKGKRPKRIGTFGTLKVL